MDELLKSLGYENVVYDDLRDDEKVAYRSMMDLREKTTELNPVQMKEFIFDCLIGVARELADHQVVDKKEKTKVEDAHLKARLKNYIYFYDFLNMPERAKKALDAMTKANHKI